MENEVNAQQQISIKKKKALKMKKCFSAVGSPSESGSGCPACAKLHISAVWLRPPAVCSQQKKRENNFGFLFVRLIFYLKLARLRERSITYDTEVQRKDFWQPSRRVCSSLKDSHPVGLRSSRADAGPAKAIFSQVAGMKPVERGAEITAPTPKCI